MSVYVDPSAHAYGRMVMCHMWADSEEELLAMADRIGVARKWIQRPPKASWVHFDIAKSKRALAVRYGAIEADRYEAVAHVARLLIAAGHTEIGERKLQMVARCRAAADARRSA